MAHVRMGSCFLNETQASRRSHVHTSTRHARVYKNKKSIVASGARRSFSTLLLIFYTFISFLVFSRLDSIDFLHVGI